MRQKKANGGPMPPADGNRPFRPLSTAAACRLSHSTASAGDEIATAAGWTVALTLAGE